MVSMTSFHEQYKLEGGHNVCALIYSTFFTGVGNFSDSIHR